MVGFNGARGKTRDEWLMEVARARHDRVEAASRKRAAEAEETRAAKRVEEAVEAIATFDPGLYLLPIVPNGSAAKVRDVVKVAQTGQGAATVEFDTINVPEVRP